MKAVVAIICLCVLALGVDYGVARMHKTRDDLRVTELQKQAREDHKFSKELALLQDTMTKERLSRKVRIKWLSVVLIGAAAGFLYLAHRSTSMQAVALDRIHAMKAKQPGALRVKRSKKAEQPSAHVVDEIVAREGRGTEALIPILQAIQERFRYLPEEALQRVCATTDITAAQIAGVSSFYSRFRRTPVGDHMVRVCHGTACHVAGARAVTDEVRRHLAIPEGGDTDPERMFTVEEVACLGCCSLAPVILVDDETAGKLTPSAACDALDGLKEQA